MLQKHICNISTNIKKTVPGPIYDSIHEVINGKAEHALDVKTA